MLTARLYAWSRRHALAIDTVTAALLVLALAPLSGESHGPAGWVFGTLTLAPLAVRRRWPVGVLVVVVVLSLVQVAVLPGVLPANVSAPIVLYTVAAHVPSFRVRLAALGSGLIGSVLAGGWTNGSPQAPSTAVTIAVSLSAFMTLVWVVGNLVRGREEMVAQLRSANELLEAEREQRDLLAAQRERVRVAREVHDIVAHSLSVVVIQADGASYAAQNAGTWDRESAAAALTAIGDTARLALGETRRVVAVLREGDAEPGPAHGRGLPDIEDLIGAVRAAGLPVTSDVPADLPAVTDEVAFTAYRVVQEALTNVIRHAGDDATGRVSLEPVPGGLRVTVSDDGTAPVPEAGAADVEGNGLQGMRERVLASGGQFLAGPRAVGGFAVTATLPSAGATESGRQGSG